MKERAKRCCARAVPRSRVEPRDVEALLSLTRARFLTTEQLERLHYGSRRVAQRRLRCLLDHGLVSAALQAEQLHRTSIFRPMAQGLDLLRDSGHDVETSRPSRLPKPGRLRHAVAVRDVFVAALQLEAQGAWKLACVLFDSDLAADAVLRAAGVVPDLLIRTRPTLSGGAGLVLGEVDLGTEPLGTLVAKLDRYKELRAGAVDYRDAELLVIVPGEGRRHRIEAFATAQGVRVAVATEIATALVTCSRRLFEGAVRAERMGGAPQLRALVGASGLRRLGA